MRSKYVVPCILGMTTDVPEVSKDD
jgi:hypothetical protein